jgi:L-threonylcarbamoyladenylate synthase
VTARIVQSDDEGLAEAVQHLRQGAVIAIPTDTVYGIAVSMETPGGIERLFHVKRRPPDKAIMLLLADAAQAPAIGSMTPAAVALGAALWPGGLTVIVPQHPDVALPEALSGGATTIGLRVPDHATPRALASAVGPLPTTSANRSGEPEARDATEINAQIGADIDLIVDGGRAHGGPASTIVDCTGTLATVLRVGAISPARIAGILDDAGIAHAISPD